MRGSSTRRVEPAWHGGFAGQRARACLCLCACLVLPSCGLFRRVEDCNAISESTRRQLSAVKARLPDAAERPTAYLEIAAAYEALAWQLGRMAPRDPALTSALRSYAEVIERAGRHSREYARALAQPTRPKQKRKQRRERLDRIRGQVKADRSRQTSVFRKLSSICHPR